MVEESQNYMYICVYMMWLLMLKCSFYRCFSINEAFKTVCCSCSDITLLSSYYITVILILMPLLSTLVLSYLFLKSFKWSFTVLFPPLLLIFSSIHNHNFPILVRCDVWWPWSWHSHGSVCFLDGFVWKPPQI